jgi:hypothetical protein|tara:strand:- start:517 stop:897 length:381 start_codon:yes stop_codon:yes gene_type:complete
MGSMRVLLLIIFGMLLTGCYTSSLTVVGPATGIASGKLTETAASQSINYVVKKQTGKAPIEYILSKNQIDKVETAKDKVNPCAKNKEFCSIVKNRVKKVQKQLMGINLQARIEKTHKQVFSKPTNN